jgi:sugar-specific transcriptional regulator TrmB
METDQLTTVLQNAGFSRYQSQAYVTLLEMGTASASDLAEASDVPQPRIYDVLRDLEKKGYVETYEQETLRARIGDPDAVVGDLLGCINDFETATDEIERRWTMPEPEPHEASIVSQFETVLNRTKQYVEDASFQVQVTVSPNQLERLRPALKAAHDRGVYVQVSIHGYEDDPPDEDDLSDICTEARARQRPAAFLALVDQKRVCYALHVHSPDEYGMIIDDRGPAYVFSWFYSTMLWELWDAIYDGRPTEPPIHYPEIRRCLTEIEPVLEAGKTITARVVGQWVDNRRPCDLTGTITDIEYEGGHDESGPLTLRDLAGQASIVLETDRGTYSVGGLGTLIEDVEADQIVVESIEE